MLVNSHVAWSRMLSADCYLSSVIGCNGIGVCLRLCVCVFVYVCGRQRVCGVWAFLGGILLKRFHHISRSLWRSCARAVYLRVCRLADISR